MTIRDLYEFVIERGTQMDPRGPEELARQMQEARAEHDALDDWGRALFDTERFRNPFGDTRILCGDPSQEVRGFLCGIDITPAEILLADRLRGQGAPADLVVGHHTGGLGGGLGSRRDTIWPQVKMLSYLGVPGQKAVKVIGGGAAGDQRSTNYQTNQVAEALGVPVMTIHSPADLYLLHAGARVLREDRPRTVGDLCDICDAWPEVRWLQTRGKGTEVAVLDRRDPLGKVYACFYGGWNPTPEVFEALCDAGCGTLWVVATSEDLNVVARKHHASIVVVPHWPADNLGLNGLFDDAMERFGAFRVFDCSNYVRIERGAR